ncbi:MAG TPA: FAD:protein FMN transferase [Solirubrobacteraceae bacterium]|jgi:thiamine biosynthesis lipoprotein|nr:FAD:protein FMN transferase [Solirubrobacteraceae bacterium]
MSAGPEIIEEFDCFGSRCAALVIGSGRAGSARDGADLVRHALLAWHQRFSRFLVTSELSRLNRDRRQTVPVCPLMAHFAQAVRSAAALSGGLVDGTLLGAIERAGYVADLTQPLALTTALALAPPRTPAAGAASRRWEELVVDLVEGTVTRPPDLMLDGGGLAKGLFADILGETLASHESFAVNCAGDLLLGGSGSLTRPIKVESPFDRRTLHTFELAHTGVATSGIGRRSWLDRNGLPAHHLLDPSTGRPAYTGVVQVTALSPSALGAEIKAKAALLSGPRAAPRWLAHGGVIVFDDGSHQVVPPPPTVMLGQLSRHVRRPGSAAHENEPATGATAG